MSQTTERERPDLRETWKPDRAEQLAACETLLLSNLSREARSAVRDIEFEITHGRTPQ